MARAESDEGAVGYLVTESEFEASFCADFCGRWLRSNNGAGFFRRGRRKKVVVVWTVCVVVVVVAYTPCSPELASDLEDSESLFTGRANAEDASSPYAGGEPPLPWVIGRFGSSKVTRLLLLGPDSDMVFLRSFLESISMSDVSSGCDGGGCSCGFARLLFTAVDLVRPGSLTRDFFFIGRPPLKSMVGAVVIISGAGILSALCQEGRPSKQFFSQIKLLNKLNASKC